MDDARKLLAWEDIETDKEGLRLDTPQQKQLQEARRRAARDLKESVWRSYKKVLLLGRRNDWKEIDLGLVHSSAADLDAALEVLRREGALDAQYHPQAEQLSSLVDEWGRHAVRIRGDGWGCR